MKRHQMVLENKLADLLRRRVALEELQVEVFADPVDQVRFDADRDLTIQTLDREATLIAEIRAALERMKDGGYGECEECGEAVGERRLNALPWARLCVHCQEGRERRAA